MKRQLTRTNIGLFIIMMDANEIPTQMYEQQKNYTKSLPVNLASQ